MATSIFDTIKLVSPNSIFEAGIVTICCKNIVVKAKMAMYMPLRRSDRAFSNSHATSSQKIPLWVVFIFIIMSGSIYKSSNSSSARGLGRHILVTNIFFLVFHQYTVVWCPFKIVKCELTFLIHYIFHIRKNKIVYLVQSRKIWRIYGIFSDNLLPLEQGNDCWLSKNRKAHSKVKDE